MGNLNQTQINFYSAQKSYADPTSRLGTGNSAAMSNNPNIQIQIPGIYTPRDANGIPQQQVAPSYQNYLFSENTKPYFRITQQKEEHK
jgi:hypothetical protein